METLDEELDCSDCEEEDVDTELLEDDCDD